MNIYEMYVRNGNKAGFWVRRNSWGKTIAQITDVANKVEGPLEGTPPYYGNPEVSAQFYNIKTGEPTTVMDDNPKYCDRISCPGTSSYTLLTLAELPDWAKTPLERGEET